MQLRRNVLTRRTAAALFLGLAAAGCTPQPAADRPAPAAFNGTDTAWIQLMIPMDERASLLTDLAPARAGRPALAAWAKEAGSRLEDELVDLRELLRLSGVPDTRPHEGHTMPGMVGLDTVRRAKNVTGTASTASSPRACGRISSRSACCVRANAPRAAPRRRRTSPPRSRGVWPSRSPASTR